MTMKQTQVLARTVLATCIAGFMWLVSTRSPQSGLSPGARLIGDAIYTVWCVALGVVLFRRRLQTGEFQYLSAILLSFPFVLIGAVLSGPYEADVIWWSCLTVVALLAVSELR